MNRKPTDPLAFLPGSNVEALVADQGAADRARERVEGDVVLREAVQGFAAEGTLPPYLPESGAKVSGAIVAVVPPSHNPALESLVIIAPEVLAPPEQKASPGVEDIARVKLLALPPGSAQQDTAKTLDKPVGATLFRLEMERPPGESPNPVFVEEPGSNQTPTLLEAPAPRRRWVAAVIALAIVGAGLAWFSWTKVAATNPAEPILATSGGHVPTATATQLATSTPPPNQTNRPAMSATAAVMPTQMSAAIPASAAPSEPHHVGASASAQPKASPATSTTAPAHPSSSSSGSAWTPNW